MTALRLFLLVLLVTMTQGKTITTTTDLSSRWYLYHTFESTNHISLDVYDYYENTVTVYLNAGGVDTFDAASSLVHCNDVKSCIVKDLRLTTGTYTLFVFNDHYFTNQRIVYTADYWTLQEEIILLVAVLVVIGTGCCMCCCLYRACCHKSKIEKLAEIYELRRSYEMKELRNNGIRSNGIGNEVKDYALLAHQEKSSSPPAGVSVV